MQNDHTTAAQTSQNSYRPPFEPADATITVARMWRNGPLRQFCALDSAPKDSRGRVQGNFLRYTSKTHDGFAGSYICENCRKVCDGVYEVRKWVGGCCRGEVLHK